MTRPPVTVRRDGAVIAGDGPYAGEPIGWLHRWPTQPPARRWQARRPGGWTVATGRCRRDALNGLLVNMYGEGAA